MDGTYVNSFDTAASANENAIGITTNNTFIWVTDIIDSKVYKYQMDGTYVNSFDTGASGNSDPRGLSTEGYFLWVTDNTADEVYKYQMDGTYTGIHFDTAASGNGDPWGITKNDTFFWIVDMTNDEVYYITDAIKQIVRNAEKWEKDYTYSLQTNEFTNIHQREDNNFIRQWFQI